MASRAFQVLQLGRESTQFTAVAATTKWRGPGGTFRDARERQFPQENIAIVGGTNRSYDPFYLAEFETAETPVTFQQSPLVFDSSFGEATATQDGAGTDYLYNYPLFDTSDPDYTTLQTHTAEYGFGSSADQYEEAEGCIVSEWEMKGSSKGAWMITSKWFGRQVTKTTMTGSVAAPSVTEALFQKTKIYLDAVSGSFGATQISSTLLEASVKCTTGWEPLFTGSGNLYYDIPVFNSDKYEIMLDLTFLVNSSAIAQRDLWLAKTPRLLQLKTEHSTAVATPGTTYTYPTLIQNYAGQWTTFGSLDNQNGTSIVKATFRNAYDETKADRGNILFVNEVTAMP